MAPSAKLKTLVNQMPDPDNRGMYTNMDKAKIETAIAEIHKGGRDSIIGLIDMLVEPGKGDDVKGHYALHVLAVGVCKPGGDKGRAEFARTVASQLAGRPKGVQRYLIRQLQVAGGNEVAPILGKALLDPALCGPAAQALLAIGKGAADQLRAALPKVKGRCRLTIILGLGFLADPAAAGAFKQAVGDDDSQIRMAATWGLARIAEAGWADAILKMADGHKGWERIQHTKACLLLAEKLLAAGNKTAAIAIYTHLRDTRTEPSELYIRQAAAKALTAAK